MKRPTHILCLEDRGPRWYLYSQDPSYFESVETGEGHRWLDGSSLFEFYDKKYITEIKPLNLENV